MNILIISIEDYGNADRCLALDSLAGSLRKHTNYTVSCLNSARVAFEEIQESILRLRPKVLCISVRPGGLDYFKRLSTTKALLEFDGLLVFGGLTVSASPEVFLESFPRSIAVSGEGEESIVLLAERHAANCVDLSVIPNISYLLNGKTEHTKRRPAKNGYISPAFDDAQLAVNNGSVCWVESSRSCSYRCSFCSVSTSHLGTRWRPLPLQQVKEQLEYLAASGAEVVSFADMNTFESLDRLLELEELFLTLPSSLKIRFDVRADSIVSPRDTAQESVRRRKALETLKDHGLVQVFIGYESSSATQLRRLRKGCKPANQDLALDRLRELGIDFVLGYMALDPLMTVEELQENADSLLETGLIRNVSTPLKQTRVQRGTPLEIEMTRKGLLLGLQGNAVYFDYNYVDPRMTTLSNALDYFYFTTAKVYRHSYITSMLRCAGRSEDVMPDFERFSYEYKLFELRLLKEGLVCAAKQDMKRLAQHIAEANLERLSRFQDLARFYASLLSSGFTRFRTDMNAFCAFVKEPQKYQLTGISSGDILQGEVKFRF